MIYWLFRKMKRAGLNSISLSGEAMIIEATANIETPMIKPDPVSFVFNALISASVKGISLAFLLESSPPITFDFSIPKPLPPFEKPPP